MDRRRFTLALAGIGCCALAPARAQQRAAIPRVAVLTFGSPANVRTRTQAFLRGMRELGYVDDENVRYEWRSANGQPDLLRRLAAELARARVDVVVSGSTSTTHALVQATATIPIVMAVVEDPVVSGFVRSLARPDTNVTGLTANVMRHIPKFLELLGSAVPKLNSAAALMNPANTTYREYRARLESAARLARLRLVVVDAATSADVERALGRAATEKVGGLVVMSDSFLFNDRVHIAELAVHHQLPAVYPHQGFSSAGGLMSYGQNLEYNYYRAAAYVDRILKGAAPAELAIEEPGKFELVINRRAARAIDLELPAHLLRRADRVIAWTGNVRFAGIIPGWNPSGTTTT